MAKKVKKAKEDKKAKKAKKKTSKVKKASKKKAAKKVSKQATKKSNKKKAATKKKVSAMEICPLRLQGQSIVVSGAFEAFDDKDGVKYHVEGEGGTLQSKPDMSTDYLVLAQRSSAAMEKKVAALNDKGAKIEVIDEEGLIGLLLPTDAELAALLAYEMFDRFPTLFPMYRQEVLVKDCDLSGVRFKNIERVALFMQNVDLTDAVMPDDYSPDLLLDCEAPGLKGYFGNATDTNLAGAYFDGAEDLRFESCDMRRARFENVELIELSGSNLAHAVLDDVVVGSSGSWGSYEYDDVKMNESRWRDSTVFGTFKNCTLKLAVFENCRFSRADFSKTVFEKTKFIDCEFDSVKFAGADLSDCDFSGSTFKIANFDKTLLKGANFKNCILLDVSSQDVNWDEAQNVPVTSKRGKAGSQVQALGRILVESETYHSVLRVSGRAGEDRLRFQLEYKTRGNVDQWRIGLDAWASWSDQVVTSEDPDDFGFALARLAGQLPADISALLPAGIALKKSKTTSNERRLALLAALHEVLGMAIPDMSDLKALDKTQALETSQAIDFLKAADVKGFNRLDPVGTLGQLNLDGLKLNGLSINTIDLAKSTLKAAALEKWHAKEVDLIQADLTEARLRKSSFEACSFRKADLRQVDGRDAQFDDCDFRGADCRNADFRGATFRHSDLSGADFSTAQLDDDFDPEVVVYNGKTVFPENVEID